MLEVNTKFPQRDTEGLDARAIERAQSSFAGPRRGCRRIRGGWSRATPRSSPAHTRGRTSPTSASSSQSLTTS